MSEALDRRCRAAYEACIASYAEMTPLRPELEALVQEPDWQALPEEIKEHWRKVVRAIDAAA